MSSLDSEFRDFLAELDGQTIDAGSEGTGGPGPTETTTRTNGQTTIDNSGTREGIEGYPEVPSGFYEQFTQETEGQKRRPGRPKGSKNRPKDPDGIGLDLSGDSELDREAKRQLKPMVETIRARHIMLGMLLGLPLETDEAKLQAFALACIRFQQEFPKTKISRKASVVIDLTVTGGVMYGPMLMNMVAAYRMRKHNQRAASIHNIPPVNPADAPQPSTESNAQPPPATEGSITGERFIIMSGVPDGGRLKFN